MIIGNIGTRRRRTALGVDVGAIRILWMSKGSRGVVYPTGLRSLEAGRHHELPRTRRAEDLVSPRSGTHLSTQQERINEHDIGLLCYSAGLKTETVPGDSRVSTLTAAVPCTCVHLGPRISYRDQPGTTMTRKEFLPCVYLPNAESYLMVWCPNKKTKRIGWDRS